MLRVVVDKLLLFCRRKIRTKRMQEVVGDLGLRRQVVVVREDRRLQRFQNLGPISQKASAPPVDGRRRAAHTLQDRSYFLRQFLLEGLR